MLEKFIMSMATPEEGWEFPKITIPSLELRVVILGTPHSELPCIKPKYSPTSQKPGAN
jgi:hypothetical protein